MVLASAADTGGDMGRLVREAVRADGPSWRSPLHLSRLGRRSAWWSLGHSATPSSPRVCKATQRKLMANRLGALILHLLRDVAECSAEPRLPQPF